MSYDFEISVLWYDTPENSPFPRAIFITPSHSSAAPTTRIPGTKYSCCYNPRTCGWEYTYAANSIPNKDPTLRGIIVLGEIDDLSGFEEVMEDAPLPVGDENCQSWVCWVVQEAVEIALLEVEAVGRLGRVPES